MEMDRRELLRWAGISGGVGLGVVVGASVLRDDEPEIEPREPPPEPDVEAPPSEPTIRHADEFGMVIDAIDEGADPSGEEPINSFIEQYADDDTLLSFPEGTYKLQPIDLSGYNHLGISAATQEQPTFIAEAGTCIDRGGSYVLFDSVEDFLLDDIKFDFSAESAGGIIRINATGDATVSNVVAEGRCDEQAAQFRLDVLDEAATALVENLLLDSDLNNTWLTGIFVGEQHAGELTFRDCTVEGFTDNGLYASAPGLEDGQGGVVHVDGGLYQNNNVSNVRLGSKGSTATGVTSISDATPPAKGEVSVNARGFRLRSGQGQLIDSCHVQITQNSNYTHGGVVFHETNGGATVRDTTIEIDRDDTPAIRLFPPNNSHDKTPEITNVEVTGTAGSGMSIFIEGRNQTVINNCTIEQSGADRDGILFRDSPDCRLVDSYIDVTGDPIIIDNASVEIENSTIVTSNGPQEVTETVSTNGAFTA